MGSGGDGDIDLRRDFRDVEPLVLKKLTDDIEPVFLADELQGFRELFLSHQDPP